MSSRNTSSFQARRSNLNSTSAASSPAATPNQWSSGPTVSNSSFSRPGSDTARPIYSQIAFPPPPGPSRSTPFTSPPIQPTQPIQPRPAVQPTFSAPNYNLYTSSQTTSPPPLFAAPMAPMAPSLPLMPQQFGMTPSSAPILPQMGGLGVLTPSRPAQSTGKSNNTFSKDDWGDFDPLS